MRQRTATWFECKVRYDKVMETGLIKKVTEQFCVDALSYTEAETRIVNEMKKYITEEFEVSDIKKAPYTEVFFSDKPSADRFYRAKLDFISLSEKTGKETRSRMTYLVQAENLKDAMKGVEEAMNGTMIYYDAAAIVDTKLLDVIEA